MERSEIARRLTAVSEQLQSTYDAFSLVLQQNTKIRVSTFKNELIQGSSVSHAERMAEIHAESITVDITRLKFTIQRLEEERDNYRFMIKYGLEEFV